MRAAKIETSITMHVRPEWAELSVYPQGEKSPALGVGFGGHPSTASSLAGKEAMERAIQLLEPKRREIWARMMAVAAGFSLRNATRP
jgi:hypothetical protein